MNLRVGRIGQLFAPAMSACLRCRTPWRFVHEHITPYIQSVDFGAGAFPLCEKCWAELTPATRVPYYRQLIGEWRAEGTEKETAILDAVQRGL